MTGQLFTQYFLTDGIRATPEWRASLSRPDAFAAFRDGLSGVFETFVRFTSPNEWGLYTRRSLHILSLQ